MCSRIHFWNLAALVTLALMGHAALAAATIDAACASIDAQHHKPANCLAGSAATPAETNDGAAAQAPTAGSERPPAAGPGRIGRYRDDIHADGDMTGLVVGEYGYKYRLVEGVAMPPYVTPARYNTSRTITTRAEDVCYCSFPKSGSTWLANVLYLVLHDGVESKDKPLRANLHWMESAWSYPRSREEVDALPSPRIFKSHMPHRMALGGGPAGSPCKHIYIARNPKDVAVSYFHFESNSSWSGGYNGPWEHWLKLFMDGRVQRGDWFDHVLSWWEQRDADNLLFLKYEELKRDFRGQLRRIAQYVGKDLTPEAFERIVGSTTFSHMRAANFSNHQHMADFQGFFRKGEIGSWKDRFTVAQSEAFDRVYRQRMAGSGLEFEFE